MSENNKLVNLTLRYSNTGKYERFTKKEEAENKRNEIEDLLKRKTAELDNSRKYRERTKDHSFDDWIFKEERVIAALKIQLNEINRIYFELQKIEKEGRDISDIQQFDIDEYLRVHEAIGVEQNFPDSLIECQALLYKLRMDCVSINFQLKQKNAKKRGGGVSHQLWVNRASTAIEIKRATISALELHAQGFRKETKASKKSLLKDMFHEAAYQLLPRDVFDQITIKAKELVALEKAKQYSEASNEIK